MFNPDFYSDRLLTEVFRYLLYFQRHYIYAKRTTTAIPKQNANSESVIVKEYTLEMERTAEVITIIIVLCDSKMKGYIAYSALFY